MRTLNNKTEGLVELIAALRALPKEISSKNGGPLLFAVRRAAKVIQNEAKLLAPVKTSRMQRAITQKRAPGDGRGKETVYVMVRPGKTRADPKGAYYFLFQELGAPNRGIQAQPFLRPALATKRGEALDQFKVALREAIDRAARKVAKLGVFRG